MTSIARLHLQNRKAPRWRGILAASLFGAAALACGAEDTRTATSPPTAGGSPAPSPALAAPAATPTPPAPEPAADPAQLAARGKAVYAQVCIACHALDPNQPGAIGPAVAGSSLELLEAKVMRNQYPEGYTPKRDTANMVPLPHLEKDMPALAAYLAEAEESS